MFKVDALGSPVLAAALAAILLAGCVDGASAQQTSAESILQLGDAVVTGFSGTVAPDPQLPLPKGKTATDLTFIDIAGFSARIMDVGQAEHPWDAHVLSPPSTLDVPASDVGQVFGIALDDQHIDDRLVPNIYLTATSAFGLNIVVPGKTRDAVPERARTGRPRAVWMEGQFGLDLQGGPGSIWKVDGVTGEVSLFANVTLDGVPNPGPALGNIAYDAAHKELFVSDLYTGMIHRFDLDGADLGHFDHGVDGRPAHDLAPVAFDPGNRLDITGKDFDSEKPETWFYAPPERRVWGLAVHDGRLFYAVAAGPQIWSVGIAKDGSFAGDPRWELDVPQEPGPFPVSDIAFSNSGAMILAERAPVTGSYDYSAFTEKAEPRVLVYWLEDPDDPNTPSRWMPVPEEYAVGFPNNSRATDGGVDLGYGYRPDGTLDTEACESALWTTGEKLRDEPTLAERLLPGGPLPVDGLQASPADEVRSANTPPWKSYYVDYDEKFEDTDAVGHVGDVRILKAPCAGAVAYGGPSYFSSPTYGGDGGYVDGGGGGGVVPDCIGPECKRPPGACHARGDFECDPKTGQWIYALSLNGPGWIDSVTVVSLTAGVSVPGGPISLNPADVVIGGAPGSSAIIEVCAFNMADYKSGKPYDCCRTQVKVKIPDGKCEKQP